MKCHMENKNDQSSAEIILNISREIHENIKIFKMIGFNASTVRLSKRNKKNYEYLSS